MDDEQEKWMTSRERQMSHSTDLVHRVLIVDDNQDAAISLAMVLGAVGFDVETSFDGQSALKTAARFKPDACILDINMPGMDGYELARRLRNNAAGAPPVIATVTAYSDDSHLDRAVDAGFDLHFTKPADPSEVAEQLEDCLNR
jgi:two-component system, OmpR family, response regulator